MASEERMQVMALYQTLCTRDLRALRIAFALDRTHAARFSTVAFCEQRIAWIDDALRARGEAVPADAE